MLIFCCSLPRSGGTLLYQIVKEIAQRGGLGRGRGFAKESYTSGVVKSQYCKPWMTSRIEAGQAVAIGSYRDLRDVVVSLRTFYTRRAEIRGPARQWTVRDVLEYRDSLLDDYYCWRRVCDTWFRYEDGDFAMSVAAGAARLLGVALSPEEQRAIVEAYSLAANQRRIRDQKPWMEAGSGSMLTKAHISPTRGRSTWREALSEADLALVEAFGGDWLREHGYE